MAFISNGQTNKKPTPNKRSNMRGCGKIFRRKKQEDGEKARAGALLKEKVAVETSLRRTLEQSYTNQEDTYGKRILQDNDSSSQTKVEIYLKSKELQRGSHVLEGDGTGQISR